MDPVFEKLREELRENRDAVLVTVVEEQGSSPGGSGAQMLVGEPGRLAGTVGGGAVEKLSEELALQLLEQRESRLRTFRLRQGEEGDTGMLCGGDVTLLFQYVPQSSRLWRDTVEKIAERLHSARSGWFLQRLDGGDPMLLNGEGGCLTKAMSCEFLLPLSGGRSGAYYVQPLPVGERAVIFGGGHIAAALAPILHSVGFRVTVFDDRPAYAGKDRFPKAERVLCGSYQDIRAQLALTEEDYVVVMTHGHQHDLEVQAQVLRGKPAYIGVIGSAAKIAAIHGRLRELGFEEARLREIHTPIGLPIKSETPAEIAVSIAAELILERAKRREGNAVRRRGCPMG